MNIDELIAAFKNLIQTNEVVSADMPLQQIKAYDSLSKLILMSWLQEEFGIKITARELGTLNTLNDLLKRIQHAA